MEVIDLTPGLYAVYTLAYLAVMKLGYTLLDNYFAHVYEEE
jgi:hypothetical protein